MSAGLSDFEYCDDSSDKSEKCGSNDELSRATRSSYHHHQREEIKEVGVRRECSTLPHGDDLDQVIVGEGRYRHRQHFDKAYRVGNLIGRGGFGSVYAGVRLSDNKMVAIKHVPRATVRLWCSSSGFSVPREICLMRQSHGTSNVVRLLDFYERPDSFVLILSKPSSYKDLFDFITERGSLDEATAQKFFKQILSAVKTLRHKNVLHRDIKDENILVNLKTNNCILIDFGSGTHYQPGTLTEFEGTHLYAPPEWLEQGEYTAEGATVWSLGVILFVMLQGDLPFSSIKDIVRGEFKFRKNCSVAARALIKECLNLNSEERLSLDDLSQHSWLTSEHSSPSKNFTKQRKYSSSSNKSNR